MHRAKRSHSPVFWLTCLVLCLSYYLIEPEAALATESNKKLPVEPLPVWTLTEEIPEPNQDRLYAIQDGIYHLVYDQQTRAEGKTINEFSRIAITPVSRAGLEKAAHLSFQYDPTDQKIILHYVHVIRDGEIQDRTDELRFTIVQREEDLKFGITDGSLTAFTELRDIQVGDIIDYAATWRNKPKLWPGHVFFYAAHEWSVPVAYSRQRLLVPKGQKLTFSKVGIDQEPETQSLGQFEEYNWTTWDTDPKLPEDAIPNTFAYWGYTTVSSMSSWEEVVKWARPHYKIDLQSNPEARTVAEKIMANTDNDAQRITEAIRYTQDKIRYVGIEIGMGSHVPRAPDKVLHHGYGDCKDKSLLLSTLLKHMGIEAYPALTHTERSPLIKTMAPAPIAFNHVIVQIIHNGKVYWIDPTSSNQGGVFPKIQQSLADIALPIAAGVVELSTIPRQAPTEPTTTRTETFDMANLETEGVQISIESVYRGIEADSMRRRLEWNSLSEFAKHYYGYYGRTYPGLKSVDDLQVTDDREENRLAVTERYQLPFDAFKNDNFHKYFPFRAEAVSSLYSTISSEKRTAPVATPIHLSREHVIVIKDAGFKLRPDKDVYETSSMLNYSVSWDAKQDDMRITYRLEPIQREIPPTQFEEYQGLVRGIQNSAYLEYNFKRRRSSRFKKK